MRKFTPPKLATKEPSSQLNASAFSSREFIILSRQPHYLDRVIEAKQNDIQLFQLTLSDQLRLTQQDRGVVWVVANQT